MSSHSAIIGGSSAGRLLNCPASHRYIQALPPSADVPSEYAETGTAMHVAMASIMDWGAGHGELLADDFLGRARTLLGTQCHDRTLTQQHVDEMIEPALRALDTLRDIYPTDFEVSAVEARVRFPGVAGAFGTVDLIMQSDEYTLVVDWKFGQGVPVKAVTADEHGEIVNPQLLYYAAAAINTFPALFRKRKIIVAVIQPRAAEPLTHVEISRKEIRQFIEDVHIAVQAATDRNPPMSRGDWCRWAPCKTVCPLWTGPLLDLSALSPTPQQPPVADVTPYGEYLARAKALLDQAAIMKQTLDEQLHAYLSGGGLVPGWRLKPKAKQRQWIDEEIVRQELSYLGFGHDEIYQTKLQTFAAADAAARRHGVTIPDHLRVAPPTSETTVARTDDPAPVVEPVVLMEQFAQSLKQLKAKELWLQINGAADPDIS